MPKAKRIKCDKCFSIMEEICRVTKLADLPEDARPCQEADYFSAIESGEFGEWTMIVVTYECKKCGNKKIVELR